MKPATLLNPNYFTGSFQEICWVFEITTYDVLESHGSE